MLNMSLLHIIIHIIVHSVTKLTLLEVFGHLKTLDINLENIIIND